MKLSILSLLSVVLVGFLFVGCAAQTTTTATTTTKKRVATTGSNLH